MTSTLLTPHTNRRNFDTILVLLEIVFENLGATSLLIGLRFQFANKINSFSGDV